jgi:hypothetical protein
MSGQTSSIDLLTVMSTPQSTPWQSISWQSTPGSPLNAGSKPFNPANTPATGNTNSVLDICSGNSVLDILFYSLKIYTKTIIRLRLSDYGEYK